jgi:flagellar biosynthesis GTPase FlhF
MRKTGLCGVVIATLFGTAGFLQHPSHQVVHTQQVQRNVESPLAQAGVNLLNSYIEIGGRKTALSATLLPEGFLQVLLKPGATPQEVAAQIKLEQARETAYRREVAEEQAEAAAKQKAAEQAQAQAEAAAQVKAAEQAQAQAEAQAQAQAQAAAEAAAAAAQAAAQQQKASSTDPSGGVWLELRQCESGDDYAADTGNGYYGAYQFLLSTWESLGFSGLPSQAPAAEQDQAAQELQARAGWDQWPACASELGL